MGTHDSLAVIQAAQTVVLVAMTAILVYAGFAVRRIIQEASGNLRLMLERQREVEASLQRLSQRLAMIEDALSRAEELRRLRGAGENPPSS